MTRIIAMAAILTILLSVAAHAGLNTDARASVHVIPHASRSCTKGFPTLTGCADIAYSEPGTDVDAFPVFFKMVEYQGLDYSMTWPGTYSTVYTSCSDLTIGGIVWPGDALSQAWLECQSGTIAVPGWAWISGTGLVRVIQHPGTHHINVGDCQGGQTPDSIPDDKSCPAGIGGVAGVDPCECATAPCTWGGIKTLFK
jgi:hypothetical protein